MSKIFVFSDIDDSIFCSLKKAPKDKKVIAVAKNKEGDDAGFATEAQINLVKLFTENGYFIPVTGRNKDTLYLYRSNWDTFQIVSHGAVVLNKDGSPNEDWLAHINPELSEAEDLLNEFMEKIKKIRMVCLAKGRSRIIKDQQIACYFCSKYDSLAVIDGIEQEMKFLVATDKRYANWKIHKNGNNVAFLPPYASKARSTKFVQDALGITFDDLTISIGDSLSDLEFMSQCAYKLVPNSSQIDQSLNSLVKKEIK